MEADTLEIELPEDEPAVFQLMVQWLYLGHVKVNFDGPDSSSAQLVEAWILGDKLGCSMFKDHVMLQLIDYHDSHWINRTIIEIGYEKTVATSKLRSWILAAFLFECTQQGSKDNSEIWPDNLHGYEEFALDVMKALSTMGTEGFRNPSLKASLFLSEMTMEDVIRFRHFATKENIDLGRQYV